MVAAFLAGINPPIKVNTTLKTISKIPLPKGRAALTVSVPVRVWIIEFIGIKSNNVIPIPRVPEHIPIINVYALKTWEILCFEAPIARSIPISLVRSITEI